MMALSPRLAAKANMNQAKCRITIIIATSSNMTAELCLQCRRDSKVASCNSSPLFVPTRATMRLIKGFWRASLDQAKRRLLD
jgi:hypothetical protein